MKQVLADPVELLELEAFSEDGSWFGKRRAAALASFREQGLPTPRTNEAWKYTKVGQLARTPFQTPLDRTLPCVAPRELSEFKMPEGQRPHLVFVNGHLNRELSQTEELPDGVTISELSEAMRDHQGELEPLIGQLAKDGGHPFVALNTARFQEGAFIEVKPGTVLEQPLNLFHTTNSAEAAVGVISHPRTMVKAGANSQFTLTDTYLGTEDSAYLTNPVTEVYLDANSQVHHYRIQRESKAAYHLSHLAVTQARDSQYTHMHLSLGGAVVRNEVMGVLTGKGAHTRLLGLNLTDGKQHIDNDTYIDHAVAHCSSFELYKSILDGNSTGAFTGRVMVRPGAQKTDAYQTNNNLLLSDKALVHTRPQLEIFADDVKCSHGATIGQLEKDSIFYLRSRGIEESCASCLLTYAFGSEVLEKLPPTKLRTQMQQLILERLPQVCNLVEDL